MNENDDILDGLASVWQQHSDRIDCIARRHDISKIELAPRWRVCSTRKRHLVDSVMMAALCVAALPAMVLLRRYYIVDIFDLLLFLFLALILAAAAAHTILRTIRSCRTPFLPGHYSHIRHPSFVHPYSRAAVLASLAVMVLFLVVPVQSGRAMSGVTLAQRAETRNNVTLVLSQISKV